MNECKYLPFLHHFQLLNLVLSSPYFLHQLLSVLVCGRESKYNVTIQFNPTILL